MAAITWVTISWLHKGTPSVLGAAIGAVAGLVAITPAAGFVTPAASVVIGLGVGLVCYGAAQLRLRARVDDALDVFAVHGVGGAFGALATGVFATAAVGGVDGLLAGNAGQLVTQVIGVVVVGAYSAIATAGILFVINLFVPIRVAGPDEEQGLDLAQHGEVAYQV
jgi:Amt family ammonium transporter